MLQNQSAIESRVELLESFIFDNLAAIGSHIKAMKEMDDTIYNSFCKCNPQLKPFFDRCEQEYKERIQD